MERMKCQFVAAGSVDPDTLSADQVLVRTVDDAKRVLLSISYDLTEGQAPESIEGLAEVMFLAAQEAAATALVAGSIATNAGANVEDAAKSATFTTRLIAAAGARIVADAVKSFCAEKIRPTHSSN